MAGRDARDGHSVGVCGVRNPACLRIENFWIFPSFDAKSNLLRAVKLKVKVRSHLLIHTVMGNSDLAFAGDSLRTF